MHILYIENIPTISAIFFSHLQELSILKHVYGFLICRW